MKVYRGKLTQENIEFLTELCEKDYTFKILADLLLEDLADFRKWTPKDWENAVLQLRKYNKRIFPIINFSYDSIKPVVSKKMMDDRWNIIDIVGKCPKIALRNLREDITKPRGNFMRTLDRVEYINQHLNYLNNRPDETKEKILRKVFSSDHPTFEDVLDFVEDKQNLMIGGAYDKQGLYDLVAKNDYDLKIVYDKGNVVVVDVTGQPGIKLLGCNSMWCFTYGSEYGLAGEQWDRYSYNGHVYAIVDFDESQNDPNFIHILFKPFSMQTEEENFLWDMANEPTFGDAQSNIIHIANGDASIINVFKFEDF